ncbi:MAG: transporter substrate-binding domain-containing protein [Candidatus Devosia phytovorans]|uniref:Transporter substrate-binding domain-containing protein n=1 Tax=Candidatus Devosia phytovorans TaxID=3121372 RepID=A0AAJ6AYD8_9HYPH|nr:transporter substrate-binding domain-containing protein [Devosia sp.]WEK03470.1 MAG: transporter substrate-binding domain-containing protein [Devosia sp.]
MALGNAIAVGVLFSASGPYAAIGREGLLGTLTAIEEINATQHYGLSLTAEVRDPRGATENYAPMSSELVAHSGTRHILGCTTSWSRKEVIPVLEKTRTTLWYACPYEGFEANEQVVYLGACPNQHVLPLLAHILPRFGADGFLVGSNYIWGWETNRIARDAMETAGGTVAGERYISLGDRDIGHIIDEIRRKRPAFILNTLIGPSSHAFLAAYHALGLEDAAFSQANRPVLSCNLAESELAQLGPLASGQYAIAPYFQSLPSAENRRFLDTVRRFAPDVTHVSAFFAQAYTAVHLLAAAIATSGTDEGQQVLAAATGRISRAPIGEIEIDATNNHSVLTPRIARATPEGFEIVAGAASVIRPDPYLARSSTASGRRLASHLKVVK